MSASHRSTLGITVGVIVLLASVTIGVGNTDAQVAPPAAAAGRGVATHMAVVGHSDLGGRGLNGAVAVVGTTAIVGAGLVADPGSTHTERFNPLECLSVPVKLVDLSDPARPRVTSTIPLAPGAAAIDVAAIAVATPRFTGVLAAVALDDGPAHTAPTRCNPSPATTERGVAYYDITDPTRPRLLGRYQADADRVQPGTAPCGPPPGSTASCANGQHSVALVQRADGRVLSVSTEPVAGLLVYESGDVRIVDVTDPAAPVQVGSWPPPGERPPTASVNGCRASNIGHDADFAAAGTRALVAFGDEGLITLDITDPSRPRRLGQFDYPEVRSVEGNASYVSTMEVAGRRLALVTDEDWFPTSSSVRIDGQSLFACEATFTLFDPQGDAQVYNRPGRQVAGDIVYAGRGCEARPSGATTLAEDPYLADPRGRIVFLDSVRDARQSEVSATGCRHDSKVKRAQQAGAVGVILARTASGSDFGFGAGGSAVAIPGDPGTAQHGLELAIPMFQVDQGDADALRQRLCPGLSGCAVQPRVTGALVDGPGEWGGVKVVDVTDPAAPKELSTAHGPGARTFPPPDLGIYSAHHTAVAGTRVLVATHADGLRVIDLSDPASPVEVASFVPPDSADPTGQMPARASVAGVAAMPGYV
ncbi:MAG: PA domain-containing protein, partial [Acidimicrobiales bacterium]